MELTHEELEKIYDRAVNALNNCTDYYLFTCAGGDEEWSQDGTYVSFTVHFSSSRNGHDWEETWYINSNGSISGEDNYFNSIEELESIW